MGKKMGKKKRTPAAKSRGEPEDTKVRQVWTKDMVITTKEEGATVLYDEPASLFNPGNNETYPPRFVVLSSLWAFKIVQEDNIPHSFRYQNWPTTFGSKNGFQSSWTNDGRPALVCDEDGTLRYPIVFNTTQLHGVEGQSMGLQATPWMGNKPHNKHSFILGEPRIAAPAAAISSPMSGPAVSDSFSGTTNPSPNTQSQSLRSPIDTAASNTKNGPPNKQTLGLPASAGKTASTSAQSPRLAPIAAASVSAAESPSLGTHHVFESEKDRRRHAFLQLQLSKRQKRSGMVIPGEDLNQAPVFPPAGKKNTRGPTLQTDAFPNLFLAEENPVPLSLQEPAPTVGMIHPNDDSTSPTPNIAPSSASGAPHQGRKRSLAQSTQKNKRIKRDLRQSLAKDEEVSTSRRVPILREEVPLVFAQDLPSAILGNEVPSFCVEEGPDVLGDDSGDDLGDDSSDDSGASSSTGEFTYDRFRNTRHAYSNLKNEHAVLKGDHKEYVEEVSRLESSLNIADGKVMLMTGALNTAFNTIMQMNETVKLGVTAAGSFLQGYEGWPDATKKMVDNIKQESDLVLASVKPTNAAIVEINTKLHELRTCFPNSKRISSSEETQEWLTRKYETGGKAVESGDKWVNHKGQDMEDFHLQ